jgi:hypothetical protein
VKETPGVPVLSSMSEGVGMEEAVEVCKGDAVCENKGDAELVAEAFMDAVPEPEALGHIVPVWVSDTTAVSVGASEVLAVWVVVGDREGEAVDVRVAGGEGVGELENDPITGVGVVVGEYVLELV